MNAARGETVLIVEGRPHRLCLTLGALAEIEAGLGCTSIGGLTARLAALSAGDLRIVLAALLRGGGEDALAQRIDRVEIAPAAAARAVVAAFHAALKA